MVATEQIKTAMRIKLNDDLLLPEGMLMKSSQAKKPGSGNGYTRLRTTIQRAVTVVDFLLLADLKMPFQVGFQ